MLQRELVEYLGVVAPDLRSGRGIERDHELMRRAQEEALADLERRDLKGRFLRVARASADVTGPVVPCDPEIRDVLRRDLIERRVAKAGVRSPVGMPLAGRYVVGVRGRARTGGTPFDSM